MNREEMTRTIADALQGQHIYFFQPSNTTIIIPIPVPEGGGAVSLVMVSPQTHAVMLKWPELCRVMEQRRGEVAAEAAYTNFNLQLGRFAIDRRDGELIFEIALPTEDGPPSGDQLAKALALGSVTVHTEAPRMRRLAEAPGALDQLRGLLDDEDDQSIAS